MSSEYSIEKGLQPSIPLFQMWTYQTLEMRA